MVQWFVLRNEVVTGPFSTDEVKNLTSQGEVQDRDLIWGRLQSEWRQIGWWMVELPNLLSKTSASKDPRLWHFAINGAAFGPFSRDDLILKLKEQQLTQDILVWTKGMKAWAPIYEFNDLLDEIGVNKRQFPRADIEGKVVVKIGAQTIEGVLLTISEGGFGADQLQGLIPGQIIAVEITSDAFYEGVNAKCEVRYVTDAGYVGFRFQGLNMESRGAIIQYVRNSGRNFTRAA